MDLMNFLKRRKSKNLSPQGSGPALNSWEESEIFFETLFATLEQQIQSNKQQSLKTLSNHLTHPHLSTLSLVEKKNLETILLLDVHRGHYSNRGLEPNLRLGYVYLSVPERLGILMEPDVNAGFFLCHFAINSISSWTQTPGTHSSEPRLVVKQKNILKFQIVEPFTVKLEDELLTLDQFCELLFEVAFS